MTTNISILIINTNLARIQVDIYPAEFIQIEYSTDLSYDNILPFKYIGFYHDIIINNLNPGTLYHFRVRSKTYDGIETLSLDNIFTTKTQLEYESLIKITRLDKGLAKIYYVSKSGNNNNNGLAISTAWATPSYAVSKSDVGDIIYLLDGTWYNEKLTFPRSGIDVAPITLSSYNEKAAILDGVNKLDEANKGINFEDKGHHHINVNGLTIKNYFSSIYGLKSASYVNITNCDLGHSGGIQAGTGSGSHHIQYENNTFHESGWNTLELDGKELATQYITHHINIINNTFYNNTTHVGAIDTMGDLEDINFIGNTLSDSNGATYFHLTYSTGVTRLSFCNNIITNSGRNEIQWCQKGMFYRNKIYNSTDSGFFVYVETGTYTSDLTFIENEIYNPSSAAFMVAHNPMGATGRSDLLLRDNIHDTDNGYQIFGDYTNGIIRFTKPPNKSIFNVYIYYSGTSTVEFIDGRLFSIQNIYNAGSHVLTSPRWYPDKSNFTINNAQGDGVMYRITTYPISARPTSGSATFTVNTSSTLLPNTIYNIKVNNIQTTTVTTDSTGTASTTLTPSTNNIITVVDQLNVTKVSLTVASTTGSSILFTFGTAPLPSISGSISGNVKNSSGINISGATISDGTRSTTTDSSGNYTITSVPAGTYTVTASATGYITGSLSNVIVTAGVTTIGVNFILQPSCLIPICKITITEL